MTRFIISLLVILLCHSVYCEDFVLTIKLSADSWSSVEKKCTKASECPTHELCITCEDGYGPCCQEPTCKDGRCGFIKPCSKRIASSILKSITTRRTTTTAASECKSDGECMHPDYCNSKCPDGSGPECASARCVKNRCQTILPCSQKNACSAKDLSQCATPQICARCKEGYSPSCAQAACENGQCKVIQPCSICNETSTTSAPTKDVCTSDGQCFRSMLCAARCANGTTPRCASAQCVDGQCRTIAPCSQLLCQNQTTCPFNKTNCAPCASSRGPVCEQPACSSGVCSVIQLCSQNLLSSTSSVSTTQQKK